MDRWAARAKASRRAVEEGDTRPAAALGPAGPSLMRMLLVDASLPEAGIAGPDMTRYFLVCASLLALVGGLAFLARRTLGVHLRRRAKERSLQVVDVLPLGGKQKLAVVRCYDRTFLLGLGDREVRSIAELDADEVTAHVPGPREPSVTEEESVPFDQRLAEELQPPSPAGTRVERGAARRDDASWTRGEGILG